MKSKSIVWITAITLIGLFTLTLYSCSDDEAEPDHGDEDPSDGTVTDIDGNVYQTVIIGDQEWMAENLRVTQYSNGEAIPTGLDNAEWGSTTEGAYAIYNNDNAMLEAYGKLYNWYAVDDTRGLCPAGWSVPSEDDWKKLEMYLGMTQEQADDVGWRGTNEGRKLKSERTALGSEGEEVGIPTNDHPRWNYHTTHFGLDEFGFSALPGGYRYADGLYYSIGYLGFWWSSSEGSSSNAWLRGMYSLFGSVYRDYDYKRIGFSVRCVRDN